MRVVSRSTTTMNQPAPFPSYLDPSLSDFNSGSHPMNPIPPDSFYGTPSGTFNTSGNNASSLRPPLRSLPQGVSSGASSADPSRPPSPTLGVNNKGDGLGKGRRRVEFTAADLDQLLRVTIEVNPYATPRNSIGEAWKEVTQKAQAAGYCLGRDVDTCKNRITSLLAWCEVSPVFFFCQGLLASNIFTFNLGGEGEEGSFRPDPPVRGRSGRFCVPLWEN